MIVKSMRFIKGNWSLGSKILCGTFIGFVFCMFSPLLGVLFQLVLKLEFIGSLFLALSYLAVPFFALSFILACLKATTWGRDHKQCEIHSDSNCVYFKYNNNELALFPDTITVKARVKWVKDGHETVENKDLPINVYRQNYGSSMFVTSMTQQIAGNSGWLGKIISRRVNKEVYDTVKPKCIEFEGKGYLGNDTVQEDYRVCVWDDPSNLNILISNI